ncbi:MAG: GGDEF domain-containing protein, partial [Thermodesulfobacteriota bacterium]|nr:GGDEF domain-containing protein [Thermodesulfobacteriota bacterium]
MSQENTRIRIENEMFSRMEKKYSEEEIVNYLMSLLVENYPLRSAVTIAVDPEGEPFVFAHRGLSRNFIKEMYAGKSFPVLLAARKDTVSIGGDDERARDPSFRFEHGYRSLFATPCRLQGETVGVFLVDSDDPGLLTTETKESFLAYSRLAAIFLALRAIRGKVSRIPDVDSVTGLNTFKYFHEVLHRELSRAEKFGHPVSLFYLKVRNLREVNGIYGHVVADAAIADLAGRIKGMLREVDYAARSGGMIYLVLPRMTKTEAGE